MAKYKIKCARCKKHYILASWKNNYPQCYYCQEHELKGEIKDSKMKKMFDIPKEFYIESSFLRDIKIKYLKYGGLTENQIETFKKVVGDLREREKETHEDNVKK